MFKVVHFKVHHFLKINEQIMLPNDLLYLYYLVTFAFFETIEFFYPLFQLYYQVH